MSQERVPRLAHERDESADSQSSEPGDVCAALQDTLDRIWRASARNPFSGLWSLIRALILPHEGGGESYFQ